MNLRTPALPRVVPPGLVDACVALVLALAGGLSGLNVRALGGHDPWVAVAVLIAMGLVLYPRRRYPEVVLTAEAAGIGVMVALGVKLDAAFLSVLVSSYSAAVYGSRRTVRVLLVATVAIMVAVTIPTAFGEGNGERALLPVPTLIAAAGAWGVGLVIRRQLALRDTAVRALAERATLVAAQQEEHAQRARLAERLRIARELHDIVAHHLSIVVIQAQAAQRVPEDERARQAMGDVERTGRTALEEMRRLLGLLRSGEQDDPPAEDADYAPALGLADLPVLAGRIRDAGLPVTLSVATEPASKVPQDVGLTVYRVVQEALTNALRHAGPAASACVTIGCRDGALDVEVTDNGRGAAAELAGGNPLGAGRGIIGMRERVRGLGGVLSAGPKAGGGYRVHAQIPM
jgi:signal transduction histidine kinase